MVSERLLEALRTAVDAEAAERASRDLLAVLLRSSGGGGGRADSAGASGSSQSTTAGVVKVVSAALAEHYRSVDAAERCALCLAAATAGQSGMVTATALRLEGALKGAVCALRQHWREPRVAAAVSKAIVRACSASAITASAFVKEKQAPSALTNALGAAAGADVADAIAALLDLLSALTKHERCATKATVDTTLRAIRAAMAASARESRWEALGAAARVLKNLAKWDSSRSVLLGAPDGARTLGELVRLLASSEPSNPAARQLTKRAYRALWILAESRLPALPTLDASWSASAFPSTGAPSPLVSAENDFERAIFPEATDILQPCADDEREQQQQAQGVAHTAHAVRGGGWVVLVAPPPSVLAAPPPARPGSHDDVFHTEGRRLAPAMMLHELRRIVEHEDVRNEIVYHNEDAGGKCSPKVSLAPPQAGVAEPTPRAPTATMLITPSVPRAIADGAWDDILGGLPLPSDFEASADAHCGAGGADVAGMKASTARGGWFRGKCQVQRLQQHKPKASSGEGKYQQRQKGGSGSKGTSKCEKGSKSAGKAVKDGASKPTYEIAHPAVHASVPPMPTIFPPDTRPPFTHRVAVPPLSFESRFERCVATGLSYLHLCTESPDALMSWRTDAHAIATPHFVCACEQRQPQARHTCPSHRVRSHSCGGSERPGQPLSVVLLCACGCGAWCVVQAQHRQHGEEGQPFQRRASAPRLPGLRRRAERRRWRGGGAQHDCVALATRRRASVLLREPIQVSCCTWCSSGFGSLAQGGWTQAQA